MMFHLRYYTPILSYHRIGAFRSDHVPTVTPAAFERQLLWLKRWQYRVIPLEALVARLERREPMPRHSVVITFDDGYVETATIAWPLLKRFGYPATVFVATAEVGTPGFVDWTQAAAMAGDNISIGSHTIHHAFLPGMPPGQAEQEIVESKQILEARLGRRMEFLSYPIGGFTAAAQAVARQAGYRAATTTNRIAADQWIDSFALRRVKITERDRAPWLFWAKLSGYYDAFRRLQPAG